MAAEPDDSFLRLQEAVDAWAAEISETRNALSGKLSFNVQAKRPAFRLAHRTPPASHSDPAVALMPEATPREPGLEPVSRDGMNERAEAAESEAKTAERNAIRLHAELAFARDQLHERNRAAQAAERAWLETAAQAEEAAQALGRAQIELDDLKRKLRGKEWALTKTRNELELLREERGNGAANAPASKHDYDALHARIDSLVRELETARAKEQEAATSAATATRRAEELAGEHARTQEVVQALNAQVNETAAHLRKTGKELERARAELAKRDEHAEAAEMLAAAQSRVAEVEQAYAAAESRIRDLEQELADAHAAAASAQRMAEQRLEALQGDYDALAASHMTLREEIQTLQQAVVERDMALERLRREAEEASAQAPAATETETGTGDGPADTARMDDLAAALAERSDALDELTTHAVGQEYLIGALKQELGAARESLERHEMDYALLAKALRAEVECLRKLAAERDFVIHHQGQELETLGRQEVALEEIKKLAGPPRQDAGADARDREVLKRELDSLRASVEEKDAALRALREQVAGLRDRLNAAAPAPDEDLRAQLQAKQAELDRSRDRIRYLRNLLKENQLDEAVSLETPADRPHPSLEWPHLDAASNHEKDSGGRAARQEPIDLSPWQDHADLQREVEETLSAQFPWPVVVLGAILAGGGLLAIGLALVVLG